METKERYEELCRLCASYNAIKMDIFGQEGRNRQLVDKIQTCLPFKIEEEDRLPKCLCYRCMYNLENFYDFRTACINAVALLERFLPPRHNAGDGMQEQKGEFAELRSELLKEKENMPILIPEAPVVNPNAALGTPPRLNSDGEADHEIEEILDNSGTDEGVDDHEDPRSDEYEMDMETNPSDFLEMTSMVTEEVEESDSAITPMSTQETTGVFQHTSEQHEVYVCSLCNKAFSSKGHLSLHARIHVGAGDVVGEKVITDDHTSYKRPYQCDLCNKSYSTAKHRWGHVSTTHRGHPAVTCRYCSRIYSTRTNLEEHIKSRHAGQPPPPELPVPYVQPDNKFQCKTCPKMYTNITDLNKHSRICVGERKKELPPSRMPVPKNKIQIDTSDLSSMESDEENKDYRDAEAKLAKNPQLTILKQALTKGDTLKRDYEDKHKTNSKPKKITRTDSSENDGQKRWFCEICPQNFTSVDSLKEHELTHDADKPFICILCEKDFTLKSSLSRHILTSHGVDPSPIIDSNKCLKKTLVTAQPQYKQIQITANDCKKEVPEPPLSPEVNLENDSEHESGHENMIEIETVFVCEICTRDFNDRASLWLHIRATHKEFAAFACGVCLKICADNTQLLNHVNMYHGGSKLQVSEQRRYSCTICGRQHDTRKKLITHVSIHNVDPGYDPASFVQLNSNYYNENLNSNEANDPALEFDGEDGEKMDCYICYKSFPSEDHLIRHQRNAHKSEPVAPMGESAGNGNCTNPGTGNGNRAQYHLFFVCELCGSSHPSKWERWLHVSSVHSNEPAIKCEREDCGKIFATRSLRNEHMQHHIAQGASPNTCEICGKLWGSRVDYWKHVMGVHSDTVPLICGVCLKVFPDVLQLSSHVKTNHWPLTNGDFSCDICGRPYSNKSKMSRHRKIHGLDVDNYVNSGANETLSESIKVEHNVIPDTDLSCEMCTNLKFSNLEDLCNHRRTAHGLFPCDLCNKCYGRTSHLWKHVNRVHKGHEDVTCRYCMKTSASKEHLAAHIAKIHRYEPETKKEIRDVLSFKSPNLDDETPHHCEKCNKGFYKRYLLRRHMKGCQNYRKDPGALLTRCRACERIFKDRASLQKHIENHHSTYTCHLCNETVTSKLGIMTHNRVKHMDHPDLTCDHSNCKKLFRTKEDRESHMKDHKYLGSPNVCDFCGDTVENKLKLKMHILSLHRNEIGVSCGVCLIPMKDPKELKKHVEQVHGGILSKPNTCQVCGKQYASKWKAFDHTKKCHGKVFKTCKQCLAVFTEDEEIRDHYENIHNVPKDQLSGFDYRLEVSVGSKQDAYDQPDLPIKQEPEDLDSEDDACDEDSNQLKRKRSSSDTFDCNMCPEIFLNDETLAEHYRNVHNSEPVRSFKKLKSEGSSAKKKIRCRENFDCKNCGKQFSTRTLFWNHINVCSRRNSLSKEGSNSFPTSILEAHLKNNNQIKKEEPEPILNESNLNIPDFNLFEDINMQLSGQKPVPNLMPLSQVKGMSSAKCSRKDSRKVYDESTNTECACEVCGKQWPAKKHLWQHLIRFHRAEAAVTCGVCLKLCKTYEDLANHLKAAHEAILSCEGNNFTCKTCGRYHNARSKLLLHMSIHINYNANVWCQKCHLGFENDEKLAEHSVNCTGKQTEFEDHSNDMEASPKNDNDRGSLAEDENSLMEEVEEVEFESEADASDNHANSNSNSDDSEDSDSDSGASSSDDGENENEDEDEDEDEDDEDAENEENEEAEDEENDTREEYRSDSRASGDVSSDSDSEADDSENIDEEDSERSEDEPEDIKNHTVDEVEHHVENTYTKDQDFKERNENASKPFEDEHESTNKDEGPQGHNPGSVYDEDEVHIQESNPDHLNNEDEDKEDLQEPCELHNESLKEEPDVMDYSDDEGPPILSPMVPLPMAIVSEHDISHLDEIRHKLSPMVPLPPKIEEAITMCELDEIRHEIENGKPSNKTETTENVKLRERTESTVNDLTGMLESESDSEHEHENENERQDEEDEMESIEDEDGDLEDVEGEDSQLESDGTDEDQHKDTREGLEETHDREDVNAAGETFEENSDEETEEMEVPDGANSVHIPNLDGTVLMVANDADGNQILIQQNVSDITNEDSNPEVTEYIYEGNAYDLGPYEMVPHNDDDVENEDDADMQSDDIQEVSDDENSIEDKDEEEDNEDDVQMLTISAKSKVSRT